MPTDLMMGMVGGAPESLDELCTETKAINKCHNESAIIVHHVLKDTHGSLREVVVMVIKRKSQTCKIRMKVV